MRKRLKRELRTEREKFFIEKLRNSPDPNLVWSLLRKFRAIGSHKNSALATFSANELNQYYATVATVHPLCSDLDLSTILNIPLNHDAPIFYFSLVDTVTAYQIALTILPKAKSNSADDLPLYYFKDVLGLVVKYMTEIFNVSIRTGVYPKLWKKSLVIPLNKVSAPTSPSETCPIANVSHFAKVFDKIVTNQIVDYLETNELLSPL